MKKIITKQFVLLLLPVMVAAAAGVFATSCRTEEKATLTVVPAAREIKFSADGLKAFDGSSEITPKFTVGTNQDAWSVTLSDPDSWLSFEKSETEFTLRAEVNRSGEQRGPIEVTVKAGDAAEIVIEVSQEGLPLLVITPAVDELKFAADGLKAFVGTNEITPQFTVETDQGQWNIALSESDSWLSFEKSETGFTLCAAANESEEERGPITVTVEAGEATPFVISVTQDGTQPSGGVVVAVTENKFDGYDYVSTAYLWREGQLTKLADNARTGRMVYSGNDIYIIGECNNKAVYWKNGQMFELPYPSGNVEYVSARAITAYGGDVYIVGWDSYGAPLYWKNGELGPRINVTQENEIYDIAVSGDDVYIAATEYDLNMDLPTAIYWKNGQKVILPPEGLSGAMCIEVVDNDVYVVGCVVESIEDETFTLGYWKNGQYNVVWDEALSKAAPTAMAISGEDIYICGQVGRGVYSGAAYWENGTIVPLGHDANARDIMVYGEYVYVVGNIYDDGRGEEVACYWKNGEMIELMIGDATATGIAMVK